MKLGIVGLPNAGKSTVFNALARARVEVKKHPFTTIEPNVGMAAVPDERLDRLAAIFQPEKTVPAMVKFVDVAGLVEGASRGQGLGNQFLAALRETDALVHVVACFRAEDIAHVLGEIDPARDVRVIRQELILADLEVCERALQKLKKGRRVLTGEEEERVGLLAAAAEALASGASLGGTEAESRLAAAAPELNLLTLKPVIYAANIGEEDLGEQAERAAAPVRQAAGRDAEVVVLCGRLEEEVGSLPQADQPLFRQEMGLGSSGLELLLAAAVRALDLVTFFTKEGVEVRAWHIRRGAPAEAAAGMIHSDMARGFIKAEVVPFADLDRDGSPAAARSRGVLRFEGRDYPVAEGDVIRFHFQ